MVMAEQTTAMRMEFERRGPMFGPRGLKAHLKFSPVIARGIHRGILSKISRSSLRLLTTSQRKGRRVKAMRIASSAYFALAEKVFFAVICVPLKPWP